MSKNKKIIITRFVIQAKILHHRSQEEDKKLMTIL